MAAQSITFLGRIAFFMRGQTATKVWPVGHLLSSHEERRQRRAKGLPLGAPGNFVDFLFRKIDMNAATLSTDIKRAAAPGLGVAVFFRPRVHPNPGGPRPPPCIALVQESTSPPVFLKRKPADHPGCLGGFPLGTPGILIFRVIVGHHNGR